MWMMHCRTIQRLVFPLLLSAVSLVGVVDADIAPTSFAGGSIIPVDVSDMHFKDAFVQIQWGAPCQLDATFEIVSDRKEPTSMEIGFPVGRYERYEPTHEAPQCGDGTGYLSDDPKMVNPSIISISVNGKQVQAFRRNRGYSGMGYLGGNYTTWYFANVVINPGSNEIKVKTELSSGEVNEQRSFVRQINYCVWTGARWGGQIEHERIEIVFPSEISDALIQEVKPWGIYKVEGKKLIWDYKDITPHGDNLDISVSVLLPEVEAILSRMRQAYRDHPEDTKAALQLARHLFLLGSNFCNQCQPGKLDAREFHRLLNDLPPSKQEIIRHFYRLERTDRYEASLRDMYDMHEGVEVRKTVYKILADYGMCENYPGLGKVLEAKEIVEGVLKKDPHNEEAWLLFLDNYWRFSLGVGGGDDRFSLMGAKQADAIRRAHELCPASKRIQAWLALVDAADDKLDWIRGPQTTREPTEFDGIWDKYEKAAGTY